MDASTELANVVSVHRVLSIRAMELESRTLTDGGESGLGDVRILYRLVVAGDEEVEGMRNVLAVPLATS